MAEIVLPVYLRLRGPVQGATERVALRTVLTAAHWLGVAAGTRLHQARAVDDSLVTLQARLDEADLRARLALEALDILSARFARIPEKRRPYYSPAQRFRILEIKNLLAWSAHRTGQTFLVCANTIYNWERGVDPTSKTVGAKVKPVPPIRRAADLVQLVVQTMARLGYGGQDMIARMLARAAWDVSARSVARYAKARRVSDPAPQQPTPTSKGRGPVVARFVHHTWMMDVSYVKQLLGPDLYMAAVFDAFSRAPLALNILDHKPNAGHMVTLLRRAANAFGKPRYVITDLGGEFVATAFKNATKRLGAVQRFASADNIKATARLERFWRTLKESAGLYGLGLPLTRDDLERRLEIALTHYVAFRPHEGLNGATPAEVFLDVEPADVKKVKPPRGRPGDAVGPPPFAFAFLQDDPQFPILVPATA